MHLSIHNDVLKQFTCKQVKNKIEPPSHTSLATKPLIHSSTHPLSHSRIFLAQIQRIREARLWEERLDKIQEDAEERTHDLRVRTCVRVRVYVNVCTCTCVRICVKENAEERMHDLWMRTCVRGCMIHKCCRITALAVSTPY